MMYIVKVISLSQQQLSQVGLLDRDFVRKHWESGSRVAKGFQKVQKTSEGMPGKELYYSGWSAC